MCACASLHVGSRGLASGLTAVPGCAGVRVRQITELRFEMQPGLAERAHVDYRERVMFIGTEFSILYTSMHSPA